MIIQGTENNDTLFGTPDDDTIYGYGGNDVLRGFDGNDSIEGGDGNDTATGDAGTLLGDGSIEPGTERVVVVVEENTLDPGGDDTLTGGLGQDEMHGGVGADRFVFLSLADSTRQHSDVIRDFDAVGGDLIDLAAIDANAGAAGDQAFAWIGTAKFSDTAGELRVDVKNNRVFVEGDVDGDGKADFAIELTGSPPLSAADFVL